MIKQQILRFKIPVNNPILMNVINTGNDLLHKFDSLRLIKPFSFDNVIKQLTTLCIFHDEMNVCFGFDDFVELDDIWMTQYFKDTDFPGDSFNIRLFDNFLFL